MSAPRPHGVQCAGIPGSFDAAALLACFFDHIALTSLHTRTTPTDTAWQTELWRRGQSHVGGISIILGAPSAAAGEASAVQMRAPSRSKAQVPVRAWDQAMPANRIHSSMLHTCGSGRASEGRVGQIDGGLRLDTAGQRGGEHVVDQAGRLQQPATRWFRRHV